MRSPRLQRKKQALGGFGTLAVCPSWRGESEMSDLKGDLRDADRLENRSLIQTFPSGSPSWPCPCVRLSFHPAGQAQRAVYPSPAAQPQSSPSRSSAAQPEQGSPQSWQPTPRDPPPAHRSSQRLKFTSMGLAPILSQQCPLEVAG